MPFLVSIEGQGLPCIPLKNIATVNKMCGAKLLSLGVQRVKYNQENFRQVFKNPDVKI